MFKFRETKWWHCIVIISYGFCVIDAVLRLLAGRNLTWLSGVLFVALLIDKVLDEILWLLERKK
jgi:hypothetical protein